MTELKAEYLYQSMVADSDELSLQLKNKALMVDNVLSKLELKRAEYNGE